MRRVRGILTYPTQLRDGVQEGDDFVGIPTHGESANGHLSQARRGAQSCTEAGDGSTEDGAKDDQRDDLE